MQLIYRPDTGEILGVHIFGLHAADLIHEASNAIALGTRIQAGVLDQKCHVLLPEIANYARAFAMNCLRTKKSIHMHNFVSFINHTLFYCLSFKSCMFSTGCHFCVNIYYPSALALVPFFLGKKWSAYHILANYFGLVQDIKFAVHAHPTLSEVLDELFKSAKVSFSSDIHF